MYLLRTAARGFPIRVKFMRSIARRRSTKKAIEPPNKNWPQAFARRRSTVTDTTTTYVARSLSGSRCSCLSSAGRENCNKKGIPRLAIPSKWVVLYRSGQHAWLPESPNETGGTASVITPVTQVG